MKKATAICDGRGNAGTGARAAVLIFEWHDRWGKQIQKYDRAEKIEPTTNIVAEHLAIQLAMELAKDHGVTDLLILNDSQTPVNHVNGTYRVKEPHLKPIVDKTWEMGHEFDSVEIRWVPREETKEADLLCRQVDRPAARRSRPGGPPAPPPKRKNPFARS
jgi:ribonuclease HI